MTSPSDNDNNTEAKNHRNDIMLNNRTERRSSISNEYYTFLLRWYNNGHIMMYLDARCETQEYRSYLLENSPFFLSSSNPKKVNGAMNTNINNKKFKLVSLRNQPMQAFSCKRECDKEASGDGGRRRKGGGIQREKERERKVGDKG